ncbi:MAG: ABC transporter permease [Magnetococcales bacterium]|nr:ABC transporter permease [Magnetococcales bacterium]MBF0439578.1 ABC transporter permease [Magnetococcales bacterium]
MFNSQETVPLEEKIYSNQSQILNFLFFLNTITKDLWRSRELSWLLFLREIRQRYRQSIFGLLWAFFPPIIATTILVFLSQHKILNVGETEIPYPVYVMLGTLLWQIFAESVVTPLKSFDSCVPIMIKINMSREAPILAGVAQVLFFMGIQMVLAVCTVIYFGLFSPAILLAPVAVLSLVIMGTAFGILLVPIGALYKDVGEGIGMLLRGVFLLTPIIYPPPQEWPWSLLVSLNPVVPLLQGCRDLMATGGLSNPFSFWMACALSAGLLIFALIFYRLTLPVVLERLGA